MSDKSQQPSPERLFSTVTAFQQSAALKGAIDLDIFTAIGEGNITAADIAKRCNATERGTRILCDYMVILEFLTKSDGKYGLTQDSAIFLDRRSPAFAGDITGFLLAPMMKDVFNDIAAVVRKGGTIVGEEGTVSPENPVWVQFARAMMPMMLMPAQMIAQLVQVDQTRKTRLLDIAAGHGVFGIGFAQRYPNMEVVAVDWAPVLEVAGENAAKFGVSDRHKLLPGSAFDVDYGNGYDLALLTNFLHHFDLPTNVGLLKKIHASLNEGGRVVTLEFVPNEDRVTPPNAAAFSMVMLASTRAGDAYTFSEFERMFGDAGFSRSEIHDLPMSPERIVISYK